MDDIREILKQFLSRFKNISTDNWPGLYICVCICISVKTYVFSGCPLIVICNQYIFFA